MAKKTKQQLNAGLIVAMDKWLDESKTINGMIPTDTEELATLIAVYTEWKENVPLLKKGGYNA